MSAVEAYSTLVPSDVQEMYEKHGLFQGLEPAMRPFMAVTRVGSSGRKVRRVGMTTLCEGLGPFGYNIVNFNGVGALTTAVLERVFFVKDENGSFVPPPQPVKGIFEVRCGRVRDRLVNIILSSNPRFERHDMDSFLSSYTGRKLTRYRLAFETINRRGLVPSDFNTEPFIKQEKAVVIIGPDGGFKRPVPRVVTPRRKEGAVGLGRYIRKLEKPLFRGIAHVYGYEVVMKGLNPEVTGRSLREGWELIGSDAVAVLIDAKRCDQHISYACLEFEHSVYIKIFHHDPELVKMLRWQRNYVGVAYAGDYKVRYRCVGVRASGDFNTSCGNILIFTLLWYAYLIGVGFVFNERAGSERLVRLFNNGDDSVLFLHRNSLPLLAGMSDWWLEMGFELEIEEAVSVFEHVAFCQTKPMWDGTTWIMVRDPVRAIAKDLVTTRSFKNKEDYDGYRSAVAQCGSALAGGVPVLAAFYDMLGRNSSREAVTNYVEFGLERILKGMSKRRGLKVSAEARASFFIMTGIAPHVQLSLEARFNDVALAWRTPPTINSIEGFLSMSA